VFERSLFALCKKYPTKEKVNKMTDSPMDFDLSAATWRRNATDEKAYIEALATRLDKALPGMVTINRAFALFSKIKPVQEILIRLKDKEYQLLYKKGQGIQTYIGHVTRGIRLSTEEVNFTDWLKQVSADLTQYANDNAGARDSLEQFLFS
jgi:hypothetical protein